MKKFDFKDCFITIEEQPVKIENVAIVESGARAKNHIPSGMVITFTLSGDLKKRITSAVNEYFRETQPLTYTEEVIGDIKATVKGCL
jgi:hypothetical protein